MAGATVREILGDTPEMSGSHQHGAVKKNVHDNHLGWVG